VILFQLLGLLVVVQHKMAKDGFSIGDRLEVKIGRKKDKKCWLIKLLKRLLWH